ncbi:HpcH/HpaI aldolase/citrate lyase family protein [Ruegeria profundi]|uniref:HpcH/HpaI aldolase/citrate lyase family protein n=1 Tax=Ruegeria profundi TaxID=1685378 RepID=UPI003C7D8091
MIRSYLFTPAHRPELVARAHERGADAILLDLEDSVPRDHKQAARDGLADAVGALKQHGMTVAIRVNADLGECVRDLEAAILPGVEAIMLPKVIGADHLRLVDDYLSMLERQAKMPDGQIKLIALIETAQALQNGADIAKATPRLTALAFGTEDFSTDCGHAPSVEALQAPAQTLVLEAKSAGLRAIGLPGSIAEIKDMDAFGDSVTLGRAIGFDAVMCIHPRQVSMVNAAFTPSATDIDHATRVSQAFDAAVAQGLGAVMLDGKMIDPPIVARAQAML